MVLVGVPLFQREQIFIDPLYALELKKLEKAVLRFMNAGFEVPHNDMLRFCRDYFLELVRARNERLAREEAWRLEWSGKKGQVKALFDSIDADGSGSIDFGELEDALVRIPDFFGYSLDGGAGDATDGMHEWLEGVACELLRSPRVLFFQSGSCGCSYPQARPEDGSYGTGSPELRDQKAGRSSVP